MRLAIPALLVAASVVRLAHAQEADEGSRAFAAREYERAMVLARAAPNEAWAQNLEGALYLEGLGVPRDEERGIALILKAAAKGFSKAQVNAGNWHEGRGEYAEALALYGKAAAQGVLEAEFRIAASMWVGHGLPQDAEAALRSIEKLAERGDRRSQAMVARFYLHGPAARRDLEKGRVYAEKAAEQGSSDGQREFGLCHRHGWGGARDDVQAGIWLGKASLGVHLEARTELAELYRYLGDGPTAAKLCAFAWAGGHERAHTLLEAWRKEGSLDASYELGRGLLVRGKAVDTERAFALLVESPRGQDIAPLPFKDPTGVRSVIRRRWLLDAIGLGYLDAVRALFDQEDAKSREAWANAFLEDLWTPLTWAARADRPRIVWFLVHQGAKPDLNPAPGRFTALHHAVQQRNLAMIRLLLSLRSNPNVLSKDGLSPLLRAASLGDAPAMRTLLDAGADRKATDGFGQTAWHLAARSGNLRTIEILGEELIHQPEDQGLLPLHIAASEGHVEMVRTLVEIAKHPDRTHRAPRGASPYDGRRDSEGTEPLFPKLGTPTALHFAASNGHMEVVKLLIAKGASARFATPKGSIAEELARAGKHEAVAEYLKAVHKKALDLFDSIKHDNSPDNAILRLSREYPAGLQYPGLLQFTVESGRAETTITNTYGIVTALLRHGVRPTAKAIDRAIMKNMFFSARSLIQEASAETLDAGFNDVPALFTATGKLYPVLVENILERGADPDARTKKHGQTALHLAARLGEEKIVKLLIKGEADVDIADADGLTALHWAASTGKADTVRMLIAAKAKLDLQDARGRTPLHWAASNGQYGYGATCALCELGAKVDIKDKKGSTARALAQNPEILQVLYDHGAR